MPQNKHPQNENLLLFPASLPESEEGVEAAGIRESRPKATADSRAAFPKKSKSTLFVKLLEGGAKLPVVAHPGEDLGYDVFALEGAVLLPLTGVKVRTGIAVEARHPATGVPLGLLVRDRSSMAAKGIATTAGVIDAGYRGEILVLMTNLGAAPVELKAGEKIAQMIPVPILTGAVEQVASLEDSARAEKGFGSSGR
jgi:dUTP pyrophosphatase